MVESHKKAVDTFLPPKTQNQRLDFSGFTTIINALGGNVFVVPAAEASR